MKKAVTILLIIFAAISVVALVVKEIASDKQSEKVGDEPVSKEAVPARKVVVNYFHGNVRCATCKKIEAYTAEAVKESFKDNELVEWRVTNTDDSGNEHFVTDYELTTRSVVVVEEIDGKPGKWKNLKEIWDLVGEKESFQNYIIKETKEIIGTE